MSQLRRALQDLRANHLTRSEGVVGIGVTRTGERTVIVVQLANEAAADGIPVSIRGIEIRTEVGGTVRTLSTRP